MDYIDFAFWKQEADITIKAMEKGRK